MKVGDLVWSLSYKPCGRAIVRRLAIIIEINNNYSNPYKYQLVACGREGNTSRQYLIPTGRD